MANWNKHAQPPAYTWANKPAAADFIGTILVTDLFVPAYFYSDGTNWLPVGGHVLLGADSDRAAQNLRHDANTTETIVATVTLPAGLLNTRGFLDIKYGMRTDTSAATKTFRVYMNEANSLDGNEELVAQSDTSSTADNGLGEMQVFARGSQTAQTFFEETLPRAPSVSTDFVTSNYSSNNVVTTADSYILFTVELSASGSGEYGEFMHYHVNAYPAA